MKTKQEIESEIKSYEENLKTLDENSQSYEWTIVSIDVLSGSAHTAAQ